MTTTETNLIEQEIIMNTRKELWTTLFCWVDFSRSKWKNQVYSKEYQFLPLTKTFTNWQKEVTEFFISKHNELEGLINSFEPWFKTNVCPILAGEEGDKVLLFRCDRLFNNKIVGESSSLFIDLLIFETDYLAKVEAKQGLSKLVNQPLFTTERLQEQVQADIEKLLKKVSYQSINTFYQKWMNLVFEQGTDLAKQVWAELPFLLNQWANGKIGSSQWKDKCEEFSKKIEHFLSNDQQKDYFFSLGGIKKQGTELGLIIATQNIKGWELDNPYLMLFWFHQKPNSINPLAYRSYFVENHSYTNPRNLYTVLFLKEDWVWKNYSRALVSMGSLVSSNHAIYNRRNLPE